MSHYRTFIFSCELFGGYVVSLDINKVNNKNDIITYCTNEIEKKLKELNLLVLQEKMKTIKHRYHIHDIDFESILIHDKKYYICNHDCE